MRTRTAFTKSTIIAIALATTLSLSGCFANPIEQLADKINGGIAEGGAEKLIEGITGGDIDIQANGTMPKDFPAEVPVVDGKIQSAVSLTIEDTKTWTVSFFVKDAKSAADLARKKLVGVGFEETMWSDASMIMGMFSNDRYNVIVSAFVDGKEQVANYQVFEQNTDK